MQFNLENVISIYDKNSNIEKINKKFQILTDNGYDNKK